MEGRLQIIDDIMSWGHTVNHHIEHKLCARRIKTKACEIIFKWIIIMAKHIFHIGFLFIITIISSLCMSCYIDKWPTTKNQLLPSFLFSVFLVFSYTLGMSRDEKADNSWFGRGIDQNYFLISAVASICTNIFVFGVIGIILVLRGMFLIKANIVPVKIPLALLTFPLFMAFCAIILRLIHKSAIRKITSLYFRAIGNVQEEN